MQKKIMPYLRYFTLLFFTMVYYVVAAQQVSNVINWHESEQSVTPINASVHPISNLPIYTVQIPVNFSSSIESCELIADDVTAISSTQASPWKNIKRNFDYSYYLVSDKQQHFLKIEVVPVRKLTQVEILRSFTVRFNVSNKKSLTTRNASHFANTSKLSSGDWYKIAVSTSGVQKLSYNLLQDLGIDVDNIDPNNLNIYGNASGELPQDNSEFRPDDLVLNKILVVGGEDGRFNKNDYILFYGLGPNTWKYNQSQNVFEHNKHRYSSHSHYFIGVNTDAPSRISTVSETELPANQVMDSYDTFQYHEKDLTNLLGSGSLWLGEHFEDGGNYDFSFSFPTIKVGEPLTIKTICYARAVGNGATAQFNVNSEGTQQAYTIFGVAAFSETSSYAKRILNQNNTVAVDPIVNVNLNFVPNSSSDEAWVDFIEVNARCGLSMSGTQIEFRDLNTVGPGNVVEMQLQSNLNNLTVWNITDKTKPVALTLRKEDGRFKHKFIGDSLNEFVAFTGASFNTPEPIGKIKNQNLHELEAVNYVVITHPNFYDAAVNLAEFHNEKQGLSYHVVNVFDIYNEFSSGTQDITAIKDFIRMLYERSGNGEKQLKYVLLFGDGSYDNRTTTGDNTNFIPTFQSDESLVPVQSYTTDDYYVLLDSTESNLNKEHIDAGIGRLPVQTIEEAQAMVRKVKRYMTGNDAGTGNVNSGDWKNNIVFIADDEDNNIHLTQSVNLSNKVATEHNEFNISKIYLDAYKQVSTPGGQRYYEAQNDLQEMVEKGALIVNYTGHGGEVGWAHERVLDLTTIKGWSNYNKLPLFMTATCEFSRFDDPERTSAGEYVLLNENGGGIALLSTTRVVGASPNYGLNLAFYNYALEQKDAFGDVNRLGEIARRVKNERASTSTNHRNFTLFGDPAIPLNFPRQKIVTTKINGVNIGAGADTLKALSKITIEGEVRNQNDSLLKDFNGTILPIVFDKPQTLKTLANDNQSFSKTFQIQSNVMFKGKANVKDGKFSFSFIVPKDIGAAYGNARVSYYAWNEKDDAIGVDVSQVVGGTNLNAVLDNVPPQINLFLNDEQFVNGGLTNESPVIVAKLFDESGLNTVGTGIGHDLIAYLDDDINNPIVLNDYYESDLDEFRSGEVKYQLKNIEKGTHTLTLKAWDVHNNSAQNKLEFVVENSEEIILDHVLNYPNPFTTFTDFHFEHNQPGTMLNVRLQVFTVSGKLVKTIEQNMLATGTKSSPIRWDGRDDFGDKIGKGVYVYKLVVKTSTGKKTELFEKLVKF